MNVEPTRSVASSIVVRNQRWIRFACYSAFLIITCCAGPNACKTAWAQPANVKSDPSQWLTGKNRDRSNSLAVSVSFTDAPFRSRLEQFSRHQKVAIFLDRRVDPGQRFSLQQTGVTVEQFIWAAADSCGLGACLIGDVYYVGPKQSAAALPLLVSSLEKSVAKLPKDTRKVWLKKSSLDWPALTEPVSILKELESKTSVKMPELPHDLWAESAWPALNLVERLSLLLVGFEKSIEIDERGARCGLADLNTQVSGKVLIQSRSVTKSLLEGLRKEIPGATFSLKGKRLSITGSADQVAAAQSWLVAAQQAEKRAGAATPFSMKAEATRLAILEKVASQTGRKLEYSDELLSTLSQRTTLDVKDVTIVELLLATMEGTGLSVEIDDENIRVVR